MFAPERCRQGTLIHSCSDWKHIATRLAEHEKSQCHRSSSEAYFVTKKGKSINHLSNLARREDVLERRVVVGCVISVIFFIAFQTLPFRSKHSESVATAFDDSAAVVNHGNFLETVKLIAEFYPTLQVHLNKVVKLAKKRDPKRKGRGNFLTFLSNISVVKILKLIAEMLKEKIATYVNDAGLFSVQMDSTTDISTHDQCAVVVRYVQEGKARERLLRLVNVSNSSAQPQSLHNLLEKSLKEVGVKLDMCVGDSFDGIGNMSGVYNGLQALLKQVRPSHVHTLRGTSVVWWSDHSPHTRWSSRARALRKLFSSFNDSSKELFSDLLMVLQHVNQTPNFRGTVLFDTKQSACGKICQSLKLS